MDLKTKKKYYNLCDPYESLKPDDKRNVDIDALGEESGTSVRGINWVDMLLSKVMLSDKPIYKLFTGHGGSGKTTEFKKLAGRLYDSEECNLFPVLIDADEIIDLENSITVPDIIASIIYSTEKAIIQEEGGNTEKTLDEGYLKRLWNWMKNTDIELNKAELTIPSAGKLVYEMKTRRTLRLRVHSIIASNFSGFIKEARDELISLNADVVRKFGRDGIVIIFDSLEKLEGTSKNWYDVLESAEIVFKVNAAYMRLPVCMFFIQCRRLFPPALRI